MSITNNYFFHVNIFRAKQFYVAYVTDALLASQKEPSSEIAGGAVLAAVKAHRRLQTHVKPEWAASHTPEDLIHRLVLLRHDDPLAVTIYLQRNSTITEVGFYRVGGSRYPVVLLDGASDTVAKLTLSQCRFRHFSTIPDGYSVELDIQGNAALDVRDETFTNDFVVR